MNAQPRPADSGNGAVVTPVLRTLLMADLADSTALIERLGDVAAAAMMQRLDLHVRDLLAFTGGRLIDKADGLLALFERPVQAVDFALRYQRSLADVANQENLSLQARIGIHVGEVMTWENPPHAVAAGAKPLEVEGLAKPVAARLMSLAMPGQILLSGMAQTLAQRAQAELGERSHKLRWLVHGRYRFKGVPAPMLVHEVGETGVAPLKLPPSGAKAWREVPLWRRPPVLAAEAILVCGLIGGSLYSVFKSPPAIAFHERDWVVVGDMSNFTADPRLEQSLDTALRISLEQSRYVNLVPELKVQAALQRMGRDGQTTIDRAVGSEIALREGARALLLPSVAEVGGRLRVNIEVVDPTTQVTVYAESAEGRGVESALTSLDTVNAELRERLGESMGDIQANGKPLAQITTPSLDALRLYTLANEAAIVSYNFRESMRLLNLALEKDPNFALAYSSRARLHLANSDYGQAKADLAKANQYRTRLSARETLVLDTGLAEFGPPAARIDQWKLFAREYPDNYRAHYQVAYQRAFYLQNYEQALVDLQPTFTSQNPRLWGSHHLAGMLYLAQERYPESRSAFEKYESLGGKSFDRIYADLFATLRQYPAAEKILARQTKAGLPGAEFDARLPEISYPLDRGEWDASLAAARGLEEEARTQAPLMARVYRGMSLGLGAYAGKNPSLEELQGFVDEERRHVLVKDDPEVAHASFAALYGVSLMARTGHVAVASRLLGELRAPALALGYPAIDDMAAIAEADIAMAQSQPAKAIDILRSRKNGGELNQIHAALLRAYRQAGQPQAAQIEAEWLAARRGRAFMEWNSHYMLLPANVFESNLALLTLAELAMDQGNAAAAATHLAAFRKAWSSPPAFVSARIAVVERKLSSRKYQTVQKPRP